MSTGSRLNGKTPKNEINRSIGVDAVCRGSGWHIVHALEAEIHFVIGGLAVLLLIAKLGGELFERIKQPTVLGELIGGIIIGNLIIIGFMEFEPLKTNAVIGALAEIAKDYYLFD
jgi:hypothetical protein